MRPMTPQELKREFEKISEAREQDKQEQLDRVESKLDTLLTKVDFLTSIQPK